MKKNLLVALMLVMITISAHSQNKQNSSDYKTAIGVKFYPGAITLKHFIKENAALEGLGYFYNRGFRVTGLYEFHFDIQSVTGLKWYVGPGAHLGFYNAKYNNDNNIKDGGVAIGLDGVIGLDYKINAAPINLSLDFQPSFELGNYNGYGGSFGGLSIRYVIK
ncbi:MAG: hypothetical protein WKF35_09015 [Ferruginibacter sp.]